MTLNFTVPTAPGSVIFSIEEGTTLYFVGANGAGKTRLAVHIESQLGDQAHRISAHRALQLNPAVAKIGEEAARRGLKYGSQNPDWGVRHRGESRWGGKAPVNLLNDYDFLIQTLFAEQANTALKTHNNVRSGTGETADATLLEELVGIWDRILPQRTLHISGDDIKVSAAGGSPYEAGEMSDGERASFYLIGQTLTAERGSLIIFDEPELHLHRAIMSRLWDELEAARPDCAMVVISHDLEFVASRSGQKVVLRDYVPPNWTIDKVPDDTGFPEELAALILGSRKPILFVEGAGSSLDRAIYRACYPNWTVISRGSCEEVIHAVVTMRANAQLTRATCAGIVDADDYDAAEIGRLKAMGIAALSVSEIENLLLLPDVIDAILGIEGHNSTSLESTRSALLGELFAHANDERNRRASVLRYARRRIDRVLKRIDLSGAKDALTLATEYAAATAAVDVAALVQAAEDAINDAIARQDAAALLRWYDNKGVLSIAAKAKGCNQNRFGQWLARALRNGTAPTLSTVLMSHLPPLSAS
jgi:ABC-type uncharacterized transport system ATPase subunit